MSDINGWIRGAWLSGMTKRDINDELDKRGTKLTLMECVAVIQIYQLMDRALPETTESKCNVEAINYKKLQGKNQ